VNITASQNSSLVFSQIWARFWGFEGKTGASGVKGVELKTLSYFQLLNCIEWKYINALTILLILNHGRDI